MIEFYKLPHFLFFLRQVKIAKSKGEQSEQAIVEIGLLTGFVPDEQSVAAITVANRVDGVGKTIFKEIKLYIYLLFGLTFVMEVLMYALYISEAFLTGDKFVPCR